MTEIAGKKKALTFQELLFTLQTVLGGAGVCAAAAV